MKKLQWNMEEVFYFPENIGVPKDARVVKVKAGFTEKRSEDAVRLSGIYHIAAKLDFTEGQRSEGIPTEAVFVDDVELEGETGYFEYAVPLYIDLPPEVGDPLHIEATDITSTFDGQGGFTVAWNVNCMYAQADSNETVSDESASEATASKDTTNSESASDVTTGKETASNQPISKETASKDTTNNKSVNDVTISKEPVSKEADLEVKKELNSTEVKTETASVEEAPKEKVVAGTKEQTVVAQVSESNQSSAKQNQKASVPVQEAQSSAMHDSTWSAQDDILSYIAALPDEKTTTRFRSNDIFVKEES